MASLDNGVAGRVSSDAMSEPIAPPGRHLLFLEGRALLELAATLSAYPFLRRAPRGDGHPVLVLPGFMASDFSTRALRRFLGDLGYAAHGWEVGRNLGPSPELAAHMVELLQRIRGRYGRRVSLVGWSLGGIYARELARRFPDDVRQVITLASPFRDVEATNVPRFLRDVARRRPLPDEADYRRILHAPLPMPTTAIYSRSDGIAAWQSCRLDEGPLSENIEVASSHLGIGHHPVALLTIADRLTQPEGAWKRFTPPARWRWPFAPRLDTEPGTS
ncbi:MAG TPA: alpha/beta hydrolase [Candidatus Eisenbacteria bacterium]|nr:alpha/beta hydrolase [Candidatus Eisenbacteria bacterium]